MDPYEQLDIARFTSRAPASRSAAWGLAILRYALAIVALWSGANEIYAPRLWTIFVPSFVGTGTLAMALIVAHGILLVAIGLSFATNYYYRIAALVFAVLILEIIISNAISLGVSAIVVSDIGLLGASLALIVIP